MTGHLEALFKVLIIAGIVIAIALTIYLTVFIIASALVSPYKLKKNIDNYYDDKKLELEELIIKTANETDEYNDLLMENRKLLTEFYELEKETERLRIDLDKTIENLEKAKNK